MPEPGSVRELRLVVTATDYDEAVRFYRDVLGMPMREAFESPDGRVTILEAGVATLEIADPNQAEFIDRVEVGRRVAGHLRVAFQVDDSVAMTRTLEAAGATVLAEADANAVGLAERSPDRSGRPAAHAVPGARRRPTERPGATGQPRIAVPIATSANAPMTMPETTLIRPSQAFVTFERKAPTTTVRTTHQRPSRGTRPASGTPRRPRSPARCRARRTGPRTTGSSSGS